MPEIVFVAHEFKYRGEQEVEFEGERYKVILTFNGMELMCERVTGF